jgi:hypothetical protein
MPAPSIPGGKAAAGGVAAAGVDWEHAADHATAAIDNADRKILTPLEVSRLRPRDPEVRHLAVSAVAAAAGEG